MRCAAAHSVRSDRHGLSPLTSGAAMARKCRLLDHIAAIAAGAVYNPAPPDDDVQAAAIQAAAVSMRLRLMACGGCALCDVESFGNPTVMLPHDEHEQAGHAKACVNALLDFADRMVSALLAAVPTLLPWAQQAGTALADGTAASSMGGVVTAGNCTQAVVHALNEMATPGSRERNLLAEANASTLKVPP